MHIVDAKQKLKIYIQMLLTFLEADYRYGLKYLDPHDNNIILVDCDPEMTFTYKIPV